jgi:hypothetical protein
VPSREFKNSLALTEERSSLDIPSKIITNKNKREEIPGKKNGFPL